VSKLEGGLWHPYRRKWATERKGHSLKDVANETLLAVMSEERKLRELGANPRGPQTAPSFVSNRDAGI
jgi:hypothetical protein